MECSTSEVNCVWFFFWHSNINYLYPPQHLSVPWIRSYWWSTCKTGRTPLTRSRSQKWRPSQRPPDDWSLAPSRCTRTRRERWCRQCTESCKTGCQTSPLSGPSVRSSWTPVVDRIAYSRQWNLEIFPNLECTKINLISRNFNDSSKIWFWNPFT